MHTITDSDIEKSIHDRLLKTGVTQDRVQAFVEEAKVTLVGTLQFEGQRRAILKVVSGVDGVSRVIDKMLVAMPRK
jgi:osmotically-inducible protein OsmY